MSDLIMWSLDNFWRFLGFIIIIGTFFGGIAKVILAFKGVKDD